MEKRSIFSNSRAEESPEGIPPFVVLIRVLHENFWKFLEIKLRSWHYVFIDNILKSWKIKNFLQNKTLVFLNDFLTLIFLCFTFFSSLFSRIWCLFYKFYKFYKFSSFLLGFICWKFYLNPLKILIRIGPRKGWKLRPMVIEPWRLCSLQNLLRHGTSVFIGHLRKHIAFTYVTKRLTV